MISGMSFLVILLIVMGIWILIEMKTFKHKVFTIILIVVIVVMYVGAVSIYKSNNIDLGSVDGATDASKLYFAWMVSVGKNVVEITTNAIKMDWGYNEEPVNKTKK